MNSSQTRRVAVAVVLNLFPGAGYFYLGHIFLGLIAAGLTTGAVCVTPVLTLPISAPLATALGLPEIAIPLIAMSAVLAAMYGLMALHLVRVARKDEMRQAAEAAEKSRNVELLQEREREQKAEENAYEAFRTTLRNSADELHVVIDTPKGTDKKLTWGFRYEEFDVVGVLPPGVVFPYDSGGLYGTHGRDQVDVMVLDDEPHSEGFGARCRLIGVIEGEETNTRGQTSENRRYIAVALESQTYGKLQTLDELDSDVVAQLERFFVVYHAANSSDFKPLHRSGATRAIQLMNEEKERFRFYQTDHSG